MHAFSEEKWLLMITDTRS